MLLHESCHFYGLQWLICLFKFSIKPGGGELESQRDAMRRCLAFACSIRGEAALVYLRWLRATTPEVKRHGFISNTKQININSRIVSIMFSHSIPQVLCHIIMWTPELCFTALQADVIERPTSCVSLSLAVTQRMMYGALRLSSQGPRAFIVCRSDRCFSNDHVPHALCTLQNPVLCDMNGNATLLHTTIIDSWNPERHLSETQRSMPVDDR